MINILVAENAKLLSNIISTELKKNNYNCTQVFSLKEIEYEVSIQNYDYIILNLYLPDAEEKDLIINVKKITNSKIIVLTSKDNDELRDYLFKYGIIDYLNKENIEQTIKNIDKLITHIEKNNKSNILIIEDSNIIRAQEAEVLRQRNYNIFESETGKDGIKIFEKENIDLVILDLELNDMNGLKILEQIKKKNPNVPVLMVSGTGNATSISKSLKNGASDFMRKPIIFEEFLLKTDMLIDYFRKSKELEDYKNNLEKKISEAIKETEDLNKELQLQKKDLIQANEAKDAFLANVSHELKTPLNSINLISAVMKKNSDNNLNKKQIKNLEIINSCGQNLQYLINDILDISKLDAGEVVLINETFDLKNSLDNLYEIILPQAENNNINFEYEFDENRKYIYSDENRIMQIIKNFLSNSLKFTKNGNILLKMEDNEDFVEISVKDNGIGIEEKKIKDIFDRFKQIDANINRKYGGTGLGLSISYALSKLLEGKITVESEIDLGSTFTLSVPKNSNMINKNDIIKFTKKYSLKESQKEKILIFNANLHEMMYFVIKLKEYFEIKQVLDLNQFNDEKKNNYKYIVLDEVLINLEDIEDLDSNIVIISNNIEKSEKIYKGLYKKIFEKPLNINEFIKYF
jgi:signal transduction histidine kinase